MEIEWVVVAGRPAKHSASFRPKIEPCINSWPRSLTLSTAQSVPLISLDSSQAAAAAAAAGSEGDDFAGKLLPWVQSCCCCGAAASEPAAAARL